MPDFESGIPAFGRTRVALLVALWCAMVVVPAAPVAYVKFTAPNAAQRYEVYLDGYSFAQQHAIAAASSDLCDEASSHAPRRLHDAFRLGCRDGSESGGHPNSRAAVEQWLQPD